MTNQAKTRREQEVWQACDDLWAQGVPFQKISLEAISAHLLELGYKKGSPNQIYQYKETWKKNRNIPDNRMNSQMLGMPLTDTISRAVALVREELQAEAQQKIREIQEEADQQILTSKEQYEIVKSQLQEIIKRSEQKETALQQAEQANKELQFLWQEEQKAHKAAAAQAEANEKFLQQYREDSKGQLTQLEKSYQNRIQELNQQLNQLTKNYKEEMNTLKTDMETQRHQWIIENDKLKTNNQKLEKECIKAQSIEENLRFVQEELKQKLNQQAKSLSDLTANYKQLENKLNHCEKIIAIKESEIKNAEVRLQEKQKEIQTLQQQLLQSQDKIGRLEEQLRFTKRAGKKEE